MLIGSGGINAALEFAQRNVSRRRPDGFAGQFAG